MTPKEILIDKEVAGLWGVILSGVGAVVSAMSITGSGGYVESSVSGFNYHIAVVNSFGLRVGFLLIALGFVFQFLERKAKDKIKLETITTSIVAIVFLFFVLQRLLFF